MEVLHKRMKTTKEGSEGDGIGGGREEEEGGGGGSGVEAEMAVQVSEEMESQIQSILQRIEGFTNQVSELLETGKAMFSNLSAQFEERLISIHRDQVEKWQEEIKDLRSLDASNEAVRSTLQSAQFHLLQSVTEA